MLSLPSGKTVYKNLDLKALDFLKALEELQNKKFTGYTALCVKGVTGLEEGTIFYDSGKIVGCVYEYYKYDRQYQGSEAFQRILNATAAKNGFADMIELTTEQVQLILAVNQKTVFIPDQKQLQNVKITEFSPLFEQKILDENPKEEDRQGLMSKYKLEELT